MAAMRALWVVVGWGAMVACVESGYEVRDTGNTAADAGSADSAAGEGAASMPDSAALLDVSAADSLADSAEEADAPEVTDATQPTDAADDRETDDATPATDAAFDGEAEAAAADASDGAPPCSSTELWCNGLCVPNDVANCGVCGNDCTNLHATSAPVCDNGQCTFPALVCQPGWGHCSSNASDGCETDLSQPANCGGCGNACSVNPICNSSGNSFSCIGVVALGAGFLNTWALFSDGTIKAWGSNTYALLGNGDDTVSSTDVPLPVVGITNAVDVQGGSVAACALLADGTVSCWGVNYNGVLGSDPSAVGQTVTPIPVAGLTGVTAIAVGGSHVCALKTDRTVVCWGYNAHGELGNDISASCDSQNPGVPCTFTPTAVVGLGGTVTAIGASDDADNGDTTCVLLADGTVQCWGYNGDGELGNGTTAVQAPLGTATPTTVPGLSNVTKLAVHNEGACVIVSGGSVKCWGVGGGGQLGNGTKVESATPVDVSGLSDAVSLSTGPEGYAICAIRASGSVVCWGNSQNGQVGSGQTGLISTPGPVVGVTNASAVAAGEYHTCILLSTGDVVCSGFNGDGELANPSADPNDNPTPLPVVW